MQGQINPTHYIRSNVKLKNKRTVKPLWTFSQANYRTGFRFSRESNNSTFGSDIRYSELGVQGIPYSSTTWIVRHFDQCVSTYFE